MEDLHESAFPCRGLASLAAPDAAVWRPRPRDRMLEALESAVGVALSVLEWLGELGVVRRARLDTIAFRF